VKSYFIILTGIIVYVIVHIEHIDGIELTHLINLNTLLIEGGIIMLLPSIFKNNFVEDFFEGFDNMFRIITNNRSNSSIQCHEYQHKGLGK